MAVIVGILLLLLSQFKLNLLKLSVMFVPMIDHYILGLVHVHRI